MKTRMIIIFILVFVLGLYFFGPKLYMRFMEAKVTDISIDQVQISNDKIFIKAKVNVSNKSIPKFIDSIGYKIEAFDTIISSGVKHLDPDRFKKEAKDQEYPAVVRYDLLKEKLKKHQGEESEVKIHIRYYYSLPFLGEQSMDVVKKVDFNIPYIPEIKLEQVEVTDFGLKHLDLIAKVKILNPNNIDFDINHISSELQLKDYVVSSGETGKIFHVNKFSETEISIPMTSEIKHGLKAMGKLLIGEDEWPYHLKSNLVIIPNKGRIKSINIETEKEGKINVVKGMKDIKTQKEFDANQP